MSQKHHSKSTDKKSKPSDKAIDTAIDRGIIDKAFEDLVNKTSKDVTIIALASENGIFHSSIKGKGYDIASLFGTILYGNDEDTKQLATILVSTPYIFCKACPDEERVKEVMDMLYASYHDLFDDDSVDPNAN